jgi:hypothetical protein
LKNKDTRPMSLRSLAVATALFAAAGTLAPATAQTSQSGATTHRVKARVHREAARPMAAAPYEACTRTGCRPVPRGCSVTLEQTWVGPTGYEIINCP